MTELGYRPRNPLKAEDFLDQAIREEWKREKGMEVFSFIDPAEPMTLIDVFIEEKLPFREVMQDLVRVTAKGISIPVVSLTHLKRLKKAAGRRRTSRTSRQLRRWKNRRGKSDGSGAEEKTFCLSSLAGGIETIQRRPS